MENRNRIRNEIRQQRSQLRLRERLRAANRLTRLVTRQFYYLKSNHIAAYFPMNGEMDPTAIVQHALAMGKQVYLPILVPFLDNRLWFARYKPGQAMRCNQFGIPEPTYSAKTLVSARTLDLILVPLLAFDHQHHRLGMGGGYYDRTFQFRNVHGHWNKPLLLGLAYEFQRVASLPQKSWDVALDRVATECNIQ